MKSLKWKKVNGSQRLFRVLVLFYVALIALPIITCFVAYYQSLRFAIDREMETQSNMAQLGMEQLERSLREADAYASSLLRLDSFEQYISAGQMPKNKLVARIRDLLDVLPVLNDGNDILSDFYIYAQASQSIVDAKGAYLRLENYYRNLFAVSGYSYAAWHDELLDDTSFSRMVSANQGEQLFYTKRISFRTRVQGRILYRLNVDGILNTFRAYSAYDELGFLALFDESGKVLYNADSETDVQSVFAKYGTFDGFTEIRIGKQNLILCATRLPMYGLTMYIATPKSYFTQRALDVSLDIALGLLPIMLLSTVLILLILRNSHRSIRETIASLSQSSEPDTLNPFKYVQQSTQRLEETNRYQEKLLEKSRMDLRSAILSALLYQKTSEHFPMEEKLSEVGLSLDAEHYRGIALMLYAADGTPISIADRVHVIILELAQSLEQDICYLCMDSPERMFFLARLDDAPEHAEKLQTKLSRLCWEITKALPCEVTAYIGCECDSLNDVYRSFRTLRDLYATRPVNGGYLVCAHENTVECAYDYTADDEKHIRHLAAVGNADELCNVLDDIYNRNQKRTQFECLLLCSHMIDTLRAVGFRDALDAEIVHSLADIPLDRFFEHMKAYYRQFCRSSLDNNRHEQQKLLQEILQYIGEHYVDEDLNMVGVALRYNLTDRHLSAWIREETGLGFPEYVEKLRIDRATELLRDSDRTIEEIAAMVGYASDKSFRRAYKRCTGQAPSASRTVF